MRKGTKALLVVVTGTAAAVVLNVAVKIGTATHSQPLAIFVVIALLAISGAIVGHELHTGVSHPGWWRRADNPGTYWFNVGIHGALFLAVIAAVIWKGANF